MKKNGFTLIELLGVIILISIISFVSFPTILNQIKKTNNQISKTTEVLVLDSAKNYVEDNLNRFPKVDGNSYCVSVNKLVNGKYLSETVLDENKDLNYKYIRVSYTSKYNYELVDNCN